MEPVTHRRRAIRDQIVDREVHRLELLQRLEREAAATPQPPEAPGVDSVTR